MEQLCILIFPDTLRQKEKTHLHVSHHYKLKMLPCLHNAGFICMNTYMILPFKVFLHPSQMFFTLCTVSENHFVLLFSWQLSSYSVQINSPTLSLLSFVSPHLPFHHAIFSPRPSCLYSPIVLLLPCLISILCHMPDAFLVPFLPSAPYLSLGSLASLSSTYTHFIPLP